MSFAHPGWLLLLVLIPLVGLVAILTAFRHKSRWDVFAAPRLRGALIRKSSMFPRWLSVIFLLAACTALIVAIARPQGDAGTRTETTRGRNIMIALDLSRSMRVDDVRPDRLAQAKIIIYELLENFPNDRIGLIGFGGRAFEYAPLTVDHKAIAEVVGQIDETWAPVGGSDLSSALKLATETLKKTGQKNNALIILSDGEENENENDLNNAANEAERSGVFIFSIGVGTTDGGYVPNPESVTGQILDSSGNPVISKLQPEILQRIAEKTGGRYATVNSGVNIPDMVGAATRDLDSFEMKGRERRIVVEFFQWLVLPAILFLMISIIAATRWRALKVAVVTFAAFTLADPAHASRATDARDALEAGRFKEARETYRKLADEAKIDSLKFRYRIGEGLAAYKNGEYREARSAYSGAMLADDPEVASSAHFGMGNTLFQLGWQGLADESYPIEPENIPDLDRFETLVKERLAKMKDDEGSEVGRGDHYVRLDSMMINWADAVRHYDSALSLSSSNQGAARNRETTLIYLRKLQEILDQEKQDADQSMPQQGQMGPGDPQNGEGEPGEDGEGDEDGEGKGKGKEPGDNGGEGDQQDRDGDGGDKEKEDSKGNKNDGDPNLTAEERARRRLEDNADLEKGPLIQGRVEQRMPKKDW